MAGIPQSMTESDSGQGKPQMSSITKIGAQSDQRFLCKCAETAQPIRGQETVGIQWGVPNS